MKTLQSAKAKTHFSLFLKDVGAGNEVAITYGKKNQAIAVIIPYEKWKKSQKRQLGTLEGKMSVEFSSDFAMTDDELINL
jgi:prevent-host-death family protein